MKRLVTVLGITAMITGFIFAPIGGSPATISANTPETATDAVCAGLGGCDEAATNTTVNSTVATVINILSLIGAVIAVIMIIIGGIRFVTSSGDSSATASARNTVIYSLVGLVIIALAQLIVRFVLERAAPAGP